MVHAGKTQENLDADITVTLVSALSHETKQMTMQVPAGSTLGEALQYLSPPFEGLTTKLENKQLGIFGKVVDATYLLKSNDRIEVYRTLISDAKESRQKKVKAQRRAK